MKDLTSVKLKKTLVEELKQINIHTWWVELLSLDDKIQHLVWFFKSYKNNNWH